ncbi:MAG: hypothetical protein R3F14_39040 [Polyangiaceae bacterium]
MESVLYREIFEEGEAQGRLAVRFAVALALANVLVRGLMHHLERWTLGVGERIRSREGSPRRWTYGGEELPGVHNAKEARRLVTKIMNATGR